MPHATAVPSQPLAARLRDVIREELRHGRVERAGRCCAVLTALEPADADAAMMGGLAHQMQGEGDRADRCLARALRLKPDRAEAWMNRAANRAAHHVAHRMPGGTEEPCGGWERQALAEVAVALSLDPALGAGHALRARLAYGLGLSAISVAAARRALALGQRRTELPVLLVDGLRRLGRAEEAERAVRAFLAPSCPGTRSPEMEAGRSDLWILLGLLRTEASDDAGAVAAGDRALALDPAQPAALVNRGNALLRLARAEEARRAFQAALAVDPDRPEAALGLGSALLDLGLWRSVPPVLEGRRRPSVAANPAGLWRRIGEAAEADGDRQAALRAFGHAARLQPAEAGHRGRLALAMTAVGQHSRGEALFRDALALAPANSTLLANSAIALVDEGRVDEAVLWLERALAADPGAHKAHSSLLFARQYLSAGSRADRRAAHRAWGERHAGSTPIPAFANSRIPDRPLRIGLVSADLKRHPVGYFLAPFLAARDRRKLVVVCYANQPESDPTDPMTRELMGLADGWRWIGGLDDPAAAAAIRGDGIDALIDLSGHTAHHRLALFAHRPAPLQATWLGYPDGTGVPAIDLIVGGGLEMPPALAGGFNERLLALPHGRFCYRPPDGAPPVSAPARSRDGRVTFGSFNTLAKLSAETVALWARVLEAVPGSRLVLKARPLGDEVVRARIRARFAAAGLDPARLDLRGWSSHGDLLAGYGDIDIALDPRPFSGGLTSCEALWMGVPVVTWPNDRPAGRQSAHFLGLLGLPELVAGDADAYVGTAAGLAGDPARLAALRAGLRERMRRSPLLDGAGFARALEAGLRKEWRRWCRDAGGK